MLHHMFYFGVILPTALVIVFFILFLIAWYKCNLRQRFTRRTLHKNSTVSHNSTQSSLVTTSSGFPYPNGPPSKDYWEIDIEHETNIDRKECKYIPGDRKECKYIPGDFSVSSADWVYMSHEDAQKVSTMTRAKTSADVHVSTAAAMSAAADTSSLDSASSTRPCLHPGRYSPQDSIHSHRSTPDHTGKIHQTALPLNVQNHRDWNIPSKPDNFRPSPIFQFVEHSDSYHCSPYAITNLITPVPAIRV